MSKYTSIIIIDTLCNIQCYSRGLKRIDSIDTFYNLSWKCKYEIENTIKNGKQIDSTETRLFVWHKWLKAFVIQTFVLELLQIREFDGKYLEKKTFFIKIFHRTE